jgi:hypothetical protein
MEDSEISENRDLVTKHNAPDGQSSQWGKIPHPTIALNNRGKTAIIIGFGFWEMAVILHVPNRGMCILA